MTRRQPKRLSVEWLERRDLMAADMSHRYRPYLPSTPSDVTAEVIDGTLYIRGGAGHDWVRIFDEGGGQIVVQSGRLIGEGKSGFVIPRSDSGDDEAAFYSGVAAMVIDLKAGNDLVSLIGRSLPRISIDTGTGDDMIRLGGMSNESWRSDGLTGPIPFPVAATIMHDLAIEMGDGNDTLHPHAIVKGNAVIRLGNGDDEVIETTKRWYDGHISQTGLTVGSGKVLDYGSDEGSDPGHPLLQATPVYTVEPLESAPSANLPVFGDLTKGPDEDTREEDKQAEEQSAAGPVYGPVEAPGIDDVKSVPVGLEEYLQFFVSPSSRRQRMGENWNPSAITDSLF
jgi:hypothetical protein